MVSLRLVGKRKQSTPFLVTVLLLLVITPRLTAFNVAKSWNPGEEHHDFFWLFKVFRRDFRLLRNTAVTAPTSLENACPGFCSLRFRHALPGLASGKHVTLRQERDVQRQKQTRHRSSGAVLTALCCRISEAHRPVIRVGGGAGFMRNLFSIILMTNRYRCCSAVANESSR